MGNLSFSGTELQHSSLQSGNLSHTDMDTHTGKSTVTSKLPPSGSTVYLEWGSLSQSSVTSWLYLWLLCFPLLKTDVCIRDNDGLQTSERILKKIVDSENCKWHAPDCQESPQSMVQERCFNLSLSENKAETSSVWLRHSLRVTHGVKWRICIFLDAQTSSVRERIMCSDNWKVFPFFFWDYKNLNELWKAGLMKSGLFGWNLLGVT